VVRIQLHDSMTQRISHISQALTMVAENLGRKNDQEPDNRARLLPVARRLIFLQAGQIEKIIQETEEASRNSRVAFETIAQHVRALGQCFWMVTETFGNEHGHGPTGDPLLLLQAAFARLSSLLSQNSAMIDQLYESARRTAGMADRLADRMRDIENIRFDVQLKALNTIIMAAHLGGQGRAMEVLARETKVLSDRSLDIASEVVTIHTDIAGLIKSLQIEDADLEERKWKAELFDHSTGIISEAMSSFNRESTMAGKRAEELRGVISIAGNGLDFLDRLAAELRRHHRLLVEIAELMPEPTKGQVDAATLFKESSRLEKLYTMNKERNLHAAVLGLGNSGGEGIGDGQPPALWRDGNSGCEESDAGRQATARQDDNVELF
jgi:hypothetical protein